MRHCKSTSSPNHDGQIAFRSELIMYNSYFILESKQTSTDAADFRNQLLLELTQISQLRQGVNPLSEGK